MTDPAHPLSDTTEFDKKAKFKRPSKEIIKDFSTGGGQSDATLEWIGKDKEINHHQEVPFRVLEQQYSYCKGGRHEEDNRSENMIIKGDNLEALKALLPRYEWRVKCIYIDPPYNTGKEGWRYNDEEGIC